MSLTIKEKMIYNCVREQKVFLHYTVTLYIHFGMREGRELGRGREGEGRGSQLVRMIVFEPTL